MFDEHCHRQAKVFIDDIKRLGDQLGKLTTAKGNLERELVDSQRAHQTAEAARAALQVSLGLTMHATLIRLGAERAVGSIFGGT